MLYYTRVRVNVSRFYPRSFWGTGSLIVPLLVAPLRNEGAATAAKDLTKLIVLHQLQTCIPEKSPASQKSVENLDSPVAKRRSQG